MGTEMTTAASGKLAAGMEADASNVLDSVIHHDVTGSQDRLAQRRWEAA
jgi:hypothetical protein